MVKAGNHFKHSVYSRDYPGMNPVFRSSFLGMGKIFVYLDQFIIY